MAEALKGTAHGNHIELEQAPSVPDGSHVLVSIEPLPVSDEERRRRILELCGAWKNDPSTINILHGRVILQFNGWISA